MASKTFSSGDVFWAPDPYSAGSNPRLWLVLAAENVPYAGEEYICAALTLSDLPDNVRLSDNDWIVGNNPEKTSYCSPWVLSTVKHDSVAEEQGYVTEAITERIIQQSIDYLAGDVDRST
jgi:hypothetical protein